MNGDIRRHIFLDLELFRLLDELRSRTKGVWF